ncbi:hypothetical protein [Rhizosphaericola mali]|uniref:Uncharacterized protein n=1 Tax=Rhizosphaericola mali TaxID=2545455 RepID=A0A5P2G0D4_9BACT|nr:hypothetical protein [Rhizosphaericola mali]QES88108.1 hypothetical protein E0W69_005320 [Rhizosphaericola mali]
MEQDMDLWLIIMITMCQIKNRLKLNIKQFRKITLYFSFLVIGSCNLFEPITVNWPDPIALPNSLLEVDNIGNKVPYPLSMSRNYPISKGIIYLRTGIILNGLIFIQPSEITLRGIKYSPVVEFVSKPWKDVSVTELKDSLIFRKLNISQIDSVKLFGIPTPYSFDINTLYINVKNEDYWRLIANNNHSKIFDVSNIGLGDISNYYNRLNDVRKIILVDGSDTIYITHSIINLNENMAKRKLKAFIKRRYKNHDFASDNVGELLNNILKQENNDSK